MKINVTDKPKMMEAKNISVGECFKYWPNLISAPSHYYICIRTDGRFCNTDCIESWPIRFIDLKNGNECGTSENTMVESLDLQVGGN